MGFCRWLSLARPLQRAFGLINAIAGQEVYYLSHSVHFTQRCLYILTWTPPQPASRASAMSPPLTLEQLLADLRLWLQMLAQHVPNAKLVLVGTRDDGSEEYQSMRVLVEAAVDAEIEQLNCRVGPECRELRRMEEECEGAVAAAKVRWTRSEVGRQYECGVSDGSDEYEQEIKWWVQQSCADAVLEQWQRRIAGQVADGLLRAQMLRQRIELMGGGSARLERVARDQSFTLDCLSGRGVAELQAKLSSLCSSHVPGMGEQLPGWWLLALNALQDGGSSEPIHKAVAIVRIRQAVRALSSPEAHPDSSIWAIVRFWADLGRIFVYEDFVLPDPLRLVELIKPLLHHDPPFLIDDECSEEHKALLLPGCHELSLRSVCLGYLRRLKHQAVLHCGLLPLLRAWTESRAFHEAMLKFLADCHLVCSTRVATDAATEVLVTARSRDLPPLYAPYPPALAGLRGDDLNRHDELQRKHDIVQSRFDHLMSSGDSCLVLFVLSRHHIGIVSRLQAFVHSARPNRINLISKAAKDCLFLCRGRRVLPDVNQHCCVVRVLPSCADACFHGGLSAFVENDGPLSKESERRAKCGVVVASNDMALLTFMVRCIEETLTRWSISADCQCYIQGPSDNCPFIQFRCSPLADSCALSLSQVLSANAWNAVVPGVSVRDIFPRQRRCAMFLSYVPNLSDNTGTRYACQAVRNGFQEAALCSVWMDCADSSQPRPWKVLVREGLQAANVYILCLTPMYLTRPSCLAELSDILTLVEMFPDRKHIIILPLHPAMTASGRRRILDTRFVLLPEYPSSAASVTRKHVLSHVAIALLERLSIYDADPDQPDPLTEKCLNLEPWLSTLPDGLPNPKWNGIEATFDLCRTIVDEEGRGLAGVLLCSDDKPINDLPFIEERQVVSDPPTLKLLTPEAAKASLVDSINGFEAIFHVFSKRDAIYLAQHGVNSNQLCELVQNFNGLQTFPRYLQRVFGEVDYRSAANAVGGCEDLSAFLDWAISPPEKRATRKVVCRVEGSDDVLLLHALFNLKLQLLQRVPGSWKEFSYGCPSAVLKIRDRKVLVSHDDFDVSALDRVRSLQGMAKLKNKKDSTRFELCWLNLDDFDLKAFDTRPRHADNASDICLFMWRWGRAIENYLLPATAPAALYMQHERVASELTAEVFVAIARHFFPVVCESESQKGKLCGHAALKWNDVIGPGWKACSGQKKWATLFMSADVKVHVDPDAKYAAETLRNFSIDLLGVAALLVAKHDDVYGSTGSRADELLLRFSAVRGDLRQGKYDCLSAKGNVQKVDWKKACSAILCPLPTVKSVVTLNRGDADDSALWFNLPAVCSFLANLCNCGWLGDALGCSDSARVKQAAAAALTLMQHALCVLLLGCDPDLPPPQSTLMSSAECRSFLPLVGCEGKAGDKQKKNSKCVAACCFNCGRDGTLHMLRPRGSWGFAPPVSFLLELCRLGSVGWAPHAFMGAVYGRTHLGVEFSAAQIVESQRMYDDHLRALLFGGVVCNDRYLQMTLSSLPAITVYVISDGKTKDGQMQPLLEQRRAEFDRLCRYIELLVDAPASASSPTGTPTTPVSPTDLAVAAGGRAASSVSSRPAQIAGCAAASRSQLSPRAAAITTPTAASAAHTLAATSSAHVASHAVAPAAISGSLMPPDKALVSATRRDATMAPSTTAHSECSQPAYCANISAPAGPTSQQALIGIAIAASFVCVVTFLRRRFQ
jgi:hypothetical protein